MAKVIYSDSIEQLIGSIGGFTFQRNSSGFVAHQKPSKKSFFSQAQNTQQSNLNYLAFVWHSLSIDVKSGWLALAIAHPRVLPGGGVRQLSGVQQFFSNNLNLLSIGEPIILSAPGSAESDAVPPYQLLFFSDSIIMSFSSPYTGVYSNLVVKASPPLRSIPVNGVSNILSLAPGQWLSSTLYDITTPYLNAYNIDLENLVMDSKTFISTNARSVTTVGGFASLENVVVTKIITCFDSWWNTENLSTGSSATKTIKLPLVSTGVYDFFVKWGDGSISHITLYNQAEVVHTYAAAGLKNIMISGSVRGWRFNNSLDRLKLININNWGSLKFSNNSSAFMGCANLTCSASDFPDFSGLTNISYFFYGCSHFNGNLSGCDVSTVSNFSYAFYACNVFNSDLKSWSTHSATNISGLFRDCRSFNSDLSAWDISHCTSLAYLFTNCSVFNSDLSRWDTHLVSSMYSTFNSCSVFSSDLSLWNVSSVTDMQLAFDRCYVFNSNLSGWNVSSVTNFYSCFGQCHLFHSDVSNWVVSSSLTFTYMFYQCYLFSSQVSGWTVSSAVNFDYMFYQCSIFNSDLSAWNIINLTSIRYSVYGTAFTIVRYSACLVAWALLAVKPNVTMANPGLKYLASAAASRAHLIASPHNWVITDGGQQ